MTSTSPSPELLLLTFTGKDHPGIASRLTGLLAEAGAAQALVSDGHVRGKVVLDLEA